LRKDVSIAAAEKREAGDRGDRSTGFPNLRGLAVRSSDHRDDGDAAHLGAVAGNHFTARSIAGADDARRQRTESKPET
jgi:hypothetical protein